MKTCLGCRKIGHCRRLPAARDGDYLWYGNVRNHSSLLREIRKKAQEHGVELKEKGGIEISKSKTIKGYVSLWVKKSDYSELITIIYPL
ncbi:MAG: hypothetical protein WCX30_01830 [Candidatus Paceibacterota bacterium]|jgi:hypothetical protein|nr:hypothetical protein [bacterium]